MAELHITPHKRFVPYGTRPTLHLATSFICKINLFFAIFEI